MGSNGSASGQPSAAAGAEPRQQAPPARSTACWQCGRSMPEGRSRCRSGAGRSGPLRAARRRAPPRARRRSTSRRPAAAASVLLGIHQPRRWPLVMVALTSASSTSSHVRRGDRVDEFARSSTGSSGTGFTTHPRSRCPRRRLELDPEPLALLRRSARGRQAARSRPGDRSAPAATAPDPRAASGVRGMNARLRFTDDPASTAGWPSPIFARRRSSSASKSWWNSASAALVCVGL